MNKRETTIVKMNSVRNHLETTKIKMLMEQLSKIQQEPVLTLENIYDNKDEEFIIEKPIEKPKEKRKSIYDLYKSIRKNK